MSTGDYFSVYAHKHSARHRNLPFPFQSTTHFSFLSLPQVLKFHLGRGETQGAHQMGTKQHLALSIYNFQAGNHVNWWPIDTEALPMDSICS